MTQTIDMCNTTEFHSILINFFSGHENDTNFEENFCKTFTFFHGFCFGIEEMNWFVFRAWESVAVCVDWMHCQSTFINDDAAKQIVANRNKYKGHAASRWFVYREFLARKSESMYTVRVQSLPSSRYHQYESTHK